MSKYVITVICGRVDMLANVKVIALNVTGVALKFVLPSSYAVDVLRDSWDEAIGNIDVPIDVRINMLIDVLAVVGVLVGTIFRAVTDFSIIPLDGMNGKNALSAAMTALEVTISPSLEEISTFCCAALTCRSMAALDCGRVLQA